MSNNNKSTCQKHTEPFQKTIVVTQLIDLRVAKQPIHVHYATRAMYCTRAIISSGLYIF